MKTVELHLPVGDLPPPGEDDSQLVAAAAFACGVAVTAVAGVRVRRRSLDARRRNHRPASWVVRCDVYLDDEFPPGVDLPTLLRPRRLARPAGDLRPIIVGMGPAGLFAALAFADVGVACTLLERGPEVERRNLDVRDLRVHGALQPESNLCYGEGGAGTYSDGKLYTRSKDPLVREVYERLVALGIDRSVLVEAHPHVGTNRLIPMMPRLRLALREAGHDLCFDARVDDLVVDDASGGPRVVGVRLADGRELIGGPVLLATGHSARDTYAVLARHGVAMAAKDFAVGTRVEHPQALIDRAQLGDLAGHPHVGAAEYFVAQQVASADGVRGVYSFCMCPGGFVLPSPTRLDHLNVNGMSNAGRGGRFGNAALVTQVPCDEMYLHEPGDLDDDPEFGVHVAGGALLGLALQGQLERAAFAAGGGGYRAPAQPLVAFVEGLGAAPLATRTSYRPGVEAFDISALLPARVVAALRQGARQIDRRQLRGYLSGEAVVIGVETTTSSPVRILRGADRQSVSHAGLFPCAEGAGYAGGIVSSAVDGLRTARTLLAAGGWLAAGETIAAAPNGKPQ